jgi:geranylgeranyl pyrophosphate synthase
MHTSDPKLIDEAIGIMKKHRSIDYAIQSAKKLVKESWKDAGKALPPTSAKEKLNAFASFLIERKI